MKTTLTVMVDNIPQGNMKGEWGLSILAEYREKMILIDAGASGLFSENMKALGFSLCDVDYAVLSHAHFDHANGMIPFFKENQCAKFYIREGTKENCYSKKRVFKKYIGIPRNVLTDYADRIEIVSGDYKICDGVYLIPHKTPGLEQTGKREKMYQKTAHRFVPDNFNHEQSVVIETDKGLVIVNCCSHGGAVNIVREVEETFPDKKIYGLIGGFHLYNKSDDEVRNVARSIKETGIKYVCTGHCTGEHAYGIMKEELGETLRQLHVGLRMEF